MASLLAPASSRSSRFSRAQYPPRRLPLAAGYCRANEVPALVRRVWTNNLPGRQRLRRFQELHIGMPQNGTPNSVIAPATLLMSTCATSVLDTSTEQRHVALNRPTIES